MTLVEEQSTLFDHTALADFHPAVRTWFTTRFPEGPTPPQIGGWPSIAAGCDTLIAAPTGSGKTLSAFLVCIDQLYRAHQRGEPLANQTRVLYVSPLRALAVDIKENLEQPLAEIAETARRLGFEPPELRVGLRTGDSTAASRAALVRKPPAFLVTTPESLYLLVTAPRSRKILATVANVIIDEIHALARDKRGSHLTLTLERLEHVCAERPVRIGLSATQKPIETVARLLVGNRSHPSDGTPRCNIVDSGHKRHLDLDLELPNGELEALASAEQMADVLDRIAELVLEHHTTLVFVNTRRMAERVAHQLSERLGEDQVAAHHGSLSKDRRLRVETSLRAGELKALVATASLELGIDIGPIDLVCQLGSPRSLATLLQRVGRSGHNRHGTPKGRIFPLSRDELVECAALLAGLAAGRLDAIEPPVAPLDILAQQIVAEAATQRWSLDDLFTLFRQAAPYCDLSRETFDRIVAFSCGGVPTGRGRRGDHLHVDLVNGEVEGRRGARLAAVTSGGAIPELADYRVIADPDETLIGTVNEEWAIESMAGDVFLLGTNTWRIRRIEPGAVRVVDAQGASPTVPFWRGEAPARTRELSEEVSHLRSVVGAYLVAGEADRARDWLADGCGLPREAAIQIVAYLAASQAVLGLLPTRDHLVIERFFDESGGMQLVVHSPYGARINRGFGLALRKRFCVTFDFELQAAASDDHVVLSLGPQHSFPLESVPRFLRSDTIEEVLCQAILVPPSPMFVARWRWNLNRSLTVLRWKNGHRNPPAIQRMESDDVMATVFPQAAACQENVSGPLHIPDHPLVTQTMHDTLTEAMDLDGLRELLSAIESGQVQVACRDTTEPSPLCHEILVGKPYTFLDGGDAADRRTRAVPLRRGLPVELNEIGRVDQAAIDTVRLEAAPDPRTPDELHDWLVAAVAPRACPQWQQFFDHLAARGRAIAVPVPGDERWAAQETASLAAALFPSALPHIKPSPEEDAALAAVRGTLETSGPITVGELINQTGAREGAVRIALAALQGEGSALQGRFRVPAAAETEWCARRLLARIHVYSQRRRRSDIKPATATDFMRFLFRWQHLHPDYRLKGDDGLLAVVAQLQGWEAPAGAWEQHLLSSRVSGYRPELIDHRGHAGDVVWARLTQPGGTSCTEVGPGSSPSRATPLAICTRADFEWLLLAHRGTALALERSLPPGPLQQIVAILDRGGAHFLSDLVRQSGRPAAEIERALWEGVSAGLLTADSFHALRSLFQHRRPENTAVSPAPARRRLRRGPASGRAPGEGRWSLVANPQPIDEPDELAEAVAEQLLARWGVLWRDLVARENLALPYRELQWALRRLEARGVIRGGRFITGFSGEQYASPEAAELLNKISRSPLTGEVLVICAADPANLTGIVTPGPRVPSLQTRLIRYVDGLPESAGHVDAGQLSLAR